MKLGPGTVLAARYRLTHPLGEGGMGEVWAATHTVTGRPVAIKRLRLSLTDRDTSARARFMLEAQAACAVEHPSVVEILDFVEHPDEPPVIVMELLQGETLAGKLAREHTLSVEETARLLLPVVSAVGTAHALGIVHRDLKPSNIFLSRSPEDALVVKVLDFGIAKWMSALPVDGPLRTQTGSTLGTPCYMSPEQAVGEKTIDHRADVWSLGVILYECLSGVRPVEGESAAQIMVRLLSTGIMPIERIVPLVPEDLAVLIGRMLSREPAHRPPDLSEVGVVLGAITATTVPEFGKPRTEIIPDAVSLAINAHASTVPVALTPDQSRMAGAMPGRALESGDRPKGKTLGRAAFVMGIGGIVGLGVLAAVLNRGGNSASNAPAPRAGAIQEQPPMQPPRAVSGVSAPPVPREARLAATTTEPIESAEHKPASRTAEQRRPKPRTASRPADSSTVASAAPSAAPGLPQGASCERSRDCASRVCFAFACE